MIDFCKKNKKGFTLIETLIAFSIVVLVMGAALEIFKNTLKTNDVFYSSLNSQEEIRKTFKLMSSDIRSASQSSLGAYAIDLAATSSFSYYSDIDGDNLKEKIRYFLSDKSLKEGIIKPTGNPLSYISENEKIHTLINNVKNSSTTPIFEYYDGNYSGAEEPLSHPLNITDIRLIKIFVQTNKSSNPNQDSISEFTTQVTIRNLKDNL